ncbi:hypothetical protein [Solemya elarraichensis gill symbiont]|uniref:BppU N-terminal domain-containing protein n=1 Tax=Solemya elarraichensis gill symbiont TaxID=1918949 RepID=A0A1T2KW33_9GAMM|nr:hypothetical protein [Solemya elarraichensis gill symbiont]OOZ37067.1 hypothetical protein BOW52_10390 [Solemya elarraichensis gill symbiont]
MTATYIIKRGDTVGEIGNTLSGVDGEPIQLFNYKIKFQARKTPDSRELLFDLQRGFGIELDNEGKSFSIKMSNTETEKFDPGNYSAELEFTTPEGVVLSCEVFILTVIKDVVR